MKTLLMTINEDRFFLSHRLPIALAAKREGWDVTVLTVDTGRCGEIRNHGLKVIPLPMQPAKVSLFDELATLRLMTRCLRRYPEAVLHNVGMKLILLGTVAARLSGHRRVINAVSGLGSVFSGIERFRRGSMADIVLRTLRRAARGHVCATLFQNEDDYRVFTGSRIPTGRCAFTKGSGIDLLTYRELPVPPLSGSRPLRVVFVGRMIREKGVCEFCEAAEMLRSRYEGKVEFVLFGGYSGNPKALTGEDISRMTDGKYIRWAGFCEDVYSQLAQCDIVVFPSYYREGLPKVLIEASAAGRPIITTDSVGCRDTVDDGVNGFLVPPRDSRAIADALSVLLEDEELRMRMGRASRLRAERDYDIRMVVDTHLRLYEDCVSNLYQDVAL